MVMPFQSLLSLTRMVVVAAVITTIGACGFFGSAWVGKWTSRIRKVENTPSR